MIDLDVDVPGQDQAPHAANRGMKYLVVKACCEEGVEVPCMVQEVDVPWLTSVLARAARARLIEQIEDRSFASIAYHADAGSRWIDKQEFQGEEDAAFEKMEEQLQEDGFVEHWDELPWMRREASVDEDRVHVSPNRVWWSCVRGEMLVETIGVDCTALQRLLKELE